MMYVIPAMLNNRAMLIITDQFIEIISTLPVSKNFKYIYIILMLFLCPTTTKKMTGFFVVCL